ncbi:MAG: thioredoxin domain-containing protein, partial [Thermomicrobiales bacterium]
MPNRLQFETSPYLLQHRDNPVDWYAWGDEAFAVATRDNKPVLISIGYSACHWCHVMAHESFENPDIASQLNDHFVCIKVDREERPDIDAIYMSAVQGMIGQGGWPLNVFTTPDGTPFFGGTYWPPADRGGMPGFPRVLSTLSSTWHAAPEKLLENADQVRAFLQNSTAALPSNPISNVTTDRAIEQLATQFDPVHGGFGNAPKFPQAPVLEFLIRHAVLRSNDTARAMALTTLDRIADGGIHDHLAGGFARYSVDAGWLVPHFEKMLYDNAQLMVLYADAFKITGNERYRTIVRSIAMWAQREMLTKEGGFCAALDADSEGEEGKFYVWTSEEIDRLLTADEADLVRLHYGVTEAGNFEHNTSILHVSRTLEDLSVAQDRDIVSLETALESAKAKLLIARADRERPGRDDKIITSWNALMIRALAVASHIIDDPDLLAMATGTAKFIKRALVTSSGHLRHSWKDNQTRGDGVLEDYAFLADALIELYRATAVPDWLNGANRLVDIVISD